MENCLKFDLAEIIKQRGVKRQGYINIAIKPDGSYVRIPVMAVCGEEEGPVILADACTHGDEYEGAEAVIKIAKELDCKTLKGTFIGVPAVNLDAANSGRRESPYDMSHADLNRVFPGSDDSFLSPYIAKIYMDKVIKKADYYITMHGGGNNLYLEPVVIYMEPSNDVGKMSMKMADAFDLQVQWKLQMDQFAGVADAEAAKIGIPVITPELGGQCVRHAERQKNVDLARTGILNVMIVLGMLEGSVKTRQDKIHVDTYYLYNEAGGIHIPLKKPLERAVKGDVLSKIENFFGETVGEVVAPFDGIVVGYWSYTVIQPHSWAFLYAKVLSV